MTRDVFISRSASKSVLHRSRSIAGVLLAVLPLGIASCKPTENKPAPETQETSAGDANAAEVVKDFGPTLLKITTHWIYDHDENYNSLLYGPGCGFIESAVDSKRGTREGVDH